MLYVKKLIRFLVESRNSDPLSNVPLMDYGKNLPTNQCLKVLYLKFRSTVIKQSC